MTPPVERVIGVLVLMIAATLSLPLIAAFLDGPGTENWIVPVHVVLMAAIGAGTAVALPGLAVGGASTGSRALIGAVGGLLIGLLVALVFWVLLTGA